MNRNLRFVAVTAAFLAGTIPAAAQKSASQSWNFDKEKPGAIAAGFTSDSGEWKVAANAGAPSKPNGFAQSAKSPGPVFNVALAADTSYKDLDISVQFIAIGGAVDQGGGVVWRATDSGNYYIARYNPLEGNFRLYKVVNGRRAQLGTAELAKHGGFYTLRVTMRGDAIECYLDGQKHLSATDTTFAAAGKIGLWTKADAETLFDNLTATSLDAK